MSNSLFQKLNQMEAAINSPALIASNGTTCGVASMQDNYLPHVNRFTGQRDFPIEGNMTAGDLLNRAGVKATSQNLFVKSLAGPITSINDNYVVNAGDVIVVQAVAIKGASTDGELSFNLSYDQIQDNFDNGKSLVEKSHVMKVALTKLKSYILNRERKAISAAADPIQINNLEMALDNTRRQLEIEKEAWELETLNSLKNIVSEAVIEMGESGSVNNSLDIIFEAVRISNKKPQSLVSLERELKSLEDELEHLTQTEDLDEDDKNIESYVEVLKTLFPDEEFQENLNQAFVF